MSSRNRSRFISPGMRVLRFVRNFLQEHGYSPTVREIAKGCGWTSTNTPAYHLRNLEADGFLKMEPGTARSIVLTEKGRAG